MTISKLATAALGHWVFLVGYWTLKETTESSRFNAETGSCA